MVAVSSEAGPGKNPSAGDRRKGQFSASRGTVFAADCWLTTDSVPCHGAASDVKDGTGERL